MTYITLGELGQSTGGLRKDIAALGTVDDSIGVGEYGGDGVTGVAFDVHVEWIGWLDDSLQLVGGCLFGKGWVENIFCKGHLLLLLLLLLLRFGVECIR